jgi:XRE family aerobic/anaerobic benzoate catabolism transcriptional regulator
MGAREGKLKLETAALDESFLRGLGEKVREARARRGMTRRLLAEASNVSERYLALLESGRGNISILLLRQIALALGLPLEDLLRENGDRPAELILIEQFLARLPRQRLVRVRERLLREFGAGMSERQGRVALIGLRGAGKSTLGALLAEDLQVPFIELDREIEREAGTSLSEIFLLYGQQGYRRYERRCLEKLIEANDGCVIATGGSIVSEPATYDLLLAACYTIWLKADPEEHMARVIAQGDTRPMAGNKQAMEDLRHILRSRAGLYGQADATIDTAKRTVKQSLKDLKRAIAA